MVGRSHVGPQDSPRGAAAERLGAQRTEPLAHWPDRSSPEPPLSATVALSLYMQLDTPASRAGSAAGAAPVA
jgi:hypothetical protein